MKVLTLGTVEAGDMVGDVAALLALPSPVTVRAVEVTRVLSIETRKFRELIDSLAGLRDMLLKKLSRNVLFLESRLMCLLSDSVPMRVLQALQDLEELPGSEPPCRIIPSHVTLARVVGTSREVVTRSLKLLVQEGRILVVGKRVFLTPGSKAGVAQNG
jgi:CRP-like cAMP-binding protein